VRISSLIFRESVRSRVRKDIFGQLLGDRGSALERIRRARTVGDDGAENALGVDAHVIVKACCLRWPKRLVAWPTERRTGERTLRFLNEQFRDQFAADIVQLL
jgi:hypothetical protein